MRYLTVFIYSIAIATALCSVPVAFEALAKPRATHASNATVGRTLLAKKPPAHRKRHHGKKARKMRHKKSRHQKKSAHRRATKGWHKKAV